MLTKHDYFCRCRTCKPPLVGEDRSRAALLAMLAIASVLAFALGAVLP